MAPVLESEGYNNSLQDNLCENWGRGSKVFDGLTKDAAGEETNIKARIEEAERLVAKINQDKLELTESIRRRKDDWNHTSCLLDFYKGRHQTRTRYCLTLEREKLNILQLFLLPLANNSHRRKPMKPSFSGEGIAKHKLNFHMVHGTNSMAEEKKLLKEVNVSCKDGLGSFSSLSLEKECCVVYENNWWLHHQRRYEINQTNIAWWHRGEIQELRWIRDRRLAIQLQNKWGEAIANANANADAASSAIQCYCQRKDSGFIVFNKVLIGRHQGDITGMEIDELMKYLSSLGPKTEQFRKEFKVVHEDMKCLKKNMALMDQRKNEANQCILELRKQQSDEFSQKAII